MEYIIWFCNAVMHWKNADGIANSVNPDQTAPEGADILSIGKP